MIYQLLGLTLGGFLVFIAAIIFTNAIEYLGSKLKLTNSFVGSILAPLFTSFPELTIFLIAVFGYGGASGEKIGMGTLYGQPFMTSTLSYGLVGITMLIGYFLRSRDDLDLEVERQLTIPYLFIVSLFPLTLIPSIFRYFYIKLIFAAIFLGSYIYYGWLMFKKRISSEIEQVKNAYFKRAIKNESLALFLQFLISIVALYYGSEILVKIVDQISIEINIDPLAISLILIPSVTALPETTSAIIWGYRGKDTLSMGALVGEQILYSTFYPGIGIAFTSWIFDPYAMVSVIATEIASLVLLYYIIKSKVPWYALFISLSFFIIYSVALFQPR